MTKTQVLRIGLTGGIASGKSTVADQFADLGVPVIDADVLAREVVAIDTPTFAMIKDHFGEAIITAEGELDRKALGKIIFADADERKWLEHLLHPQINDKMLQKVGTLDTPYCILVIPLLVEKELYHLVDRILVVDTPRELQIKRTLQRDQLSPEAVENILASQASREQRLAKTDDIISNDRDLAHLKQQVLEHHKKYLRLTNEISSG